MTLVHFARYDLDTGAILATGICDDTLLSAQAQNPAEGALQIEPGVFARDWYIDITAHPPAPAQRPVFSGAIDKAIISSGGTDAATLSGLPNPSKVTVIGTLRHDVTAVTTGSLAITSASPGLLAVYVDAFPQKLWRTSIVAS